MLEGNSGEIDFGPSKRDVRVSERLVLSGASCNNKRGQWDRKEVIFREVQTLTTKDCTLCFLGP